MSTWRVLGERAIADTPFFRVRAEQCEIEAGQSLDYYLIDAADWVNVLAITIDLDLVTVRQYRALRR